MMANKFLDDNTYTNKTWSEVSGIELEEINRMEREFLMGVDFNLYVDKPTYESWLNLLKGLVIAKERDARSRAEGHRRRESRKVTNARSKAAEYQRQSNYSAQQMQRTYHHHPQAYVTRQGFHRFPVRSLPPATPRARSTSPTSAYGVRSSMVDSPADTYTSSAHGHPAMVHPSTHLRVDTTTTTQPNPQQHPSSASSISSSNKRTAEAALLADVCFVCGPHSQQTA
ncbi:hypothetical protein BKA70DRAFT_187966 [Coprinopsis sp. MPI-PUGE-AT-0042]|nr:hypothetical protein BKA70DRAFT_187966 [Coprinopsis sp. MPI-PUGE-AT-0042]